MSTQLGANGASTTLDGEVGSAQTLTETHL